MILHYVLAFHYGLKHVTKRLTNKRLPNISVPDKCNKCRIEKPCVVLRNKDCYCTSCFLIGTVHKFKALLGKHRLLHPNDKVLIYHKAGHPSTALLHFLRTGLDLKTPKKLRFVPTLLYIDDQLHITSEERYCLLNDIENQVRQYNFEIYFVSLLDYIEENVIKNLLTKDSRDMTIRKSSDFDQFIEKNCSETHKNDIIDNFRRKILLDAAKVLGCKFVFVPDISFDVASHILTNISLGRGQHLSLDTSICDSRDPDVMILRPLRHFDLKELSMYNYLNGLEPVSVREFVDATYNSVHSLIQKFVENIKADYPATVNTIVKTGDKLALNRDPSLENICELCKAPFLKESSLSAAESTAFSSWISTQEVDESDLPENHFNKILNSFQNSDCSTFCYACKNLSHLIKL